MSIDLGLINTSRSKIPEKDLEKLQQSFRIIEKKADEAGMVDYFTLIPIDVAEEENVEGIDFVYQEHTGEYATSTYDYSEDFYDWMEVVHEAAQKLAMIVIDEQSGEYIVYKEDGSFEMLDELPKSP